MGTVIPSNLPHREDTELTEGPFKLDSMWAHLSKEEGALGVKHGVPVEGQRDRHPALPTGRHQRDRVVAQLQRQMVPASIVHVEVEGHRAPGPQVDNCPAGKELQAQLQPVLPVADSKEEGMVDSVGAEAQHQCQLCAKGSRDDGGRGSLQPGPLCENEAQRERDDSRRCGALATACLRPAEAQLLEDIDIFRSSLGGGQVTGK